MTLSCDTSGPKLRRGFPHRDRYPDLDPHGEMGAEVTGFDILGKSSMVELAKIVAMNSGFVTKAKANAPPMGQ